MDKEQDAHGLPSSAATTSKSKKNIDTISSSVPVLNLEDTGDDEAEVEDSRKVKFTGQRRSGKIGQQLKRKTELRGKISSNSDSESSGSGKSESMLEIC
jgi:hypothetical protein